MENLIKLFALLPSHAELQSLLQNDTDEAAYILHLANESINKIKVENTSQLEAAELEESRYLVECLVDKCWERIHTGHFSAVPLGTRKLYVVANFFKIFYLLLESLSPSQVEKCSALLDEAQLLGCTQDLYQNCGKLMQELTKLLDNLLGDCTTFDLPILEPLKRQQLRCDIPQIECPSLDDFRQNYFEPQQPALLLHTISHWPAMEKWHDLNYLLKMAGNRTVPIEIGSNYANDEWSQQLVKIRDFLRRQFAVSATGTDKDHKTEIEYLAQHELFDQIPALKLDIRIPDYCTLTSSVETFETPSVDIMAWLGPGGTISPMHYDPKHNLLCQVFGQKRIILAAPTDTPNLYAHESEFLGNTSQIDAAHLDCERFPLAAQVRFYELTLQQGDCLYMPPKWWHYVRAESSSFSVSFWWE